MSVLSIDILPVGVLLVGAALIALAGRFVKSPSPWGPITLLLIVLAGVSLYPAVGAWLSAPLSDEADAAADRWSTVWQIIALAIGFLIALLSLDDATDSDRSPKKLSASSSLLACSIAGWCALATASNLWLLFAAGRLVVWPVLFGYRRTADVLVDRPFSENLRKSVRNAESPTSDPVVLMLWREAWSMLLMLIGLGILAGWTGCGSLSLAELREFQPAAQSSLMPGITGVLLVIVGAGWTVPLHFESLDIAEHSEHPSAAWWLTSQMFVAAITDSTIVVRTSLGEIVSAETMLVVFAGWALVLGSFLLRRQVQLRRWLAALVLVQSGWWMTAVALAVAQQKMSGFAPLTEMMYPHNITTLPYLVLCDVTAMLGFAAVCRFVLGGERELEYLDDLRGLLKQHRAAAVLASASLLSLLSLPFTAGFWGRWQIVCGVWSVQLVDPRTGLPAVHGGFVILALAAVVAQIAFVHAVWQPLRMMLFEDPAGRVEIKDRQAALSVAIVAAFFAVGVGLMPDAILRALRQMVTL